MNKTIIMIGAMCLSSAGSYAALTATKDYTSNGYDFTGVVNDAYIWGMDKNPINNVGEVDVDGNGVKDFHESGATNVNTSNGMASNNDGGLFRWDYGGSPSREAGLETGNNSYTFEFRLNILGDGTEVGGSVFGAALKFGTGQLQMEIGYTGINFMGGDDSSLYLSNESLGQSNVGFHTWRIAYDADLNEMYIFRDGELLNLNGEGVDVSNNLGSPSYTLIGNYSGRMEGDWELDYLALDSTGAFAPGSIPEPSAAVLLGFGGVSLVLTRKRN